MTYAAEPSTLGIDETDFNGNVEGVRRRIWESLEMYYGKYYPKAAEDGTSITMNSSSSTPTTLASIRISLKVADG